MVFPIKGHGGHRPGEIRAKSGLRRDRPPAVDEVVGDLRELRARGLLRVRRLSLPALDQAASAAGFDPGAGGPHPVDRLLRAAAENLGDEGPGLEANYLFGLVQGTLGRSPTELRARAAAVFGRSAETFRKDREKQVLGLLAEEILRLAAQGGWTTDPAAVAERRLPSDHASNPAPASDPAGVLGAELQRLLLAADAAAAGPLQAGVAPRHHLTGRTETVEIPVPDGLVAITVHLGDVATLRGTDILVTSSNVYLDPSRSYAATLLGRVRTSAAVRDRSGAVVRDVVAEELSAWMRAAGGPDRPVQPGRVVPTSAGALEERGIRRLYHAAVAEPVTASNDYLVAGPTIARAVSCCFELARAERTNFTPPLASICFPLIGAGRAGLDPAVSFSWLWPVIAAETGRDERWHVHLSTWTAAEAIVVLRALIRTVSDAARSGGPPSPSP